MSADRYFTRGLFEFLKDLDQHNNRDWFQANKERYETQVQQPFLRLIADLAPGLKKINPGFAADPRPNGGSMMRIYRTSAFRKTSARTRRSSRLTSATRMPMTRARLRVTSGSNRAHR